MNKNIHHHHHHHHDHAWLALKPWKHRQGAPLEINEPPFAVAAATFASCITWTSSDEQQSETPLTTSTECMTPWGHLWQTGIPEGFMLKHLNRSKQSQISSFKPPCHRSVHDQTCLWRSSHPLHLAQAGRCGIVLYISLTFIHLHAIFHNRTYSFYVWRSLKQS